jgi:hypothetical protein
MKIVVIMMMLIARAAVADAPTERQLLAHLCSEPNSTTAELREQVRGSALSLKTPVSRERHGRLRQVSFRVDERVRWSVGDWARELQLEKNKRRYWIASGEDRDDWCQVIPVEREGRVVAFQVRFPDDLCLCVEDF